jgi:hypothetical protein
MFQAPFQMTAMHRFRMVIVQARSQVVSNYYVSGHGCFEKPLPGVAWWSTGILAEKASVMPR